MGLIKLFSKHTLSTLRQAVDDMQQAFAEVNTEDFEKKFDSLKENFNKEFEKLAKKFKKIGKKYVIEVPYDRDTQTLSYRINNESITITVETREETENGSFKSKTVTTTNIPEDVCVEKITQKYLKDEKKMLFILKRIEDKVESIEDDFEPIDTETPQNEEVKENVVDALQAKEQLIKKMVHMHLNGCSFRKIAQECGVSDKTVKRWIGLYLTEHDTEGLL